MSIPSLSTRRRAPLLAALMLLWTGAAVAQVEGAASAASPSEADHAISVANQQRLALTRQYLMNQQYQSHQQQLASQRGYSSGVGQGAANSGQARGHELGQQQGGVSVGALVSESHGDETGGGGFAWQFAPQSNTLMVEGDNNAPIQLSNINANGGNVHIGDVHKGNLYNSQIGNNQQGSQGGDTTNAQSNDQQQRAASQSGSRDAVSN